MAIGHSQSSIGLISVENGLHVAAAPGNLVRIYRVVGGLLMAVVRPDWSGENTLNQGPEPYAPPDRRAPAQPYDVRIAPLRPQTEAGESNDGPSEIWSANPTHRGRLDG